MEFIRKFSLYFYLFSFPILSTFSHFSYLQFIFSPTNFRFNYFNFFISRLFFTLFQLAFFIIIFPYVLFPFLSYSLSSTFVIIERSFLSFSIYPDPSPPSSFFTKPINFDSNKYSVYFTNSFCRISC